MPYKTQEVSRIDLKTFPIHKVKLGGLNHYNYLGYNNSILFIGTIHRFL